MDQSASIDLGQSYQWVFKISVPPLDILVSKECLGQTVSTWEKLVCMLATSSKFGFWKLSKISKVAPRQH